MHWFFALIISVFLAIPTAAQASACADTPRSVVERFHATLLGVMKEADALGIKGRYERLVPDMTACFDMVRMIRIAAGTHWRKAGPDDRKSLVDAFSRMSISTYASRFNGHSGESFETLSEGPGPQKTQLVKTQIVRPADGPVGFIYVLVKTKAGWRIADILLDNAISQLAKHRSEYRQTLETQGASGLVAVLNGKADSLLTE